MTAAPSIWINGELLDAADAHLSPLDHGVTVGNGVFETMKVVADPDGTRQAFALRRHLRRLHRSAEAMGLPLERADDELRAAVRQVLDANPGADGRVRITVTGGVGPLGSDRPGGPTTVIVASAAATPWAPTTGVTVVPWRRNEHSAISGVKSTSYGENVVALERAHQHGSSEAIFANTAGNLCEGTGSNVFAVLDGRLITPTLASGCLAGITRELLLECVDVDEVDVPIDRLAEAQEVFLTSSTRDVHPVATVDGVGVPACPGPRTVEAAEAFAAIQRRSLDP